MRQWLLALWLWTAPQPVNNACFELQTKYVGFTDGKDKRIIEKPHNNYQPNHKVKLGWT